jgi:hypothetical protein
MQTEWKERMQKDKRASHLTASEFLASDRSGMNQQRANARWQFLLALQRQVPEIFERLRSDVLPVFARLAKPGYWKASRSFSMRQSRCDPDGELTPVLMEWARRFNLDGEIWVLEGALQTLSIWNAFPDCRENLDIQGFRTLVCVPGLISDQEHAFHFEDEGWDPTLISFLGWRVQVQERFEKAIQRYRHQMQALVKKRGGVPAALKYSEEHFDWLALYHCANATLDSIAKGARYGDKTTISKGMHQAAKLAGIPIRAKGKLKSR